MINTHNGSSDASAPLASGGSWRSFVLRWMGLSLILHLVASWFSVGHHSVDEYFQILEFLSYKRGLTPINDLPVEFHEKMRPWMQPFVYAQMIRVWEWLGVHNPFTWAWSFRLSSSLIGWGATVGLAFRARRWFSDPRAQRFCVLALALIWFYPALHARPSSEGLGGSAFLCALVLITAENPGLGALLGAGALLGLSFEARFQMGLMIAGLLAWALIVRRLKPFQIAATLAGLAIVFALGRWIDRWGYGEWVLSPWRYVEYNLLRGEVNRFGQAPVWDVFRMSFTESWPFLGLGLAIASVVAWVRHPWHPLTWSQLPFFAAHEWIAHKELRFFFPIAAAGPVLLTLALTQARSGEFIDPLRAWPKALGRGWPERLTRWVWYFLLLNNAVALVALLFVPFSRPVWFYQSVWGVIPPDTQRFEIFYKGSDPYHMLGNPVYFYRPPALVTTPFESYSDLVTRLSPNRPLWLFEPSLAPPPEGEVLARHCVPVIRSLPMWVTHLNFNGWLERAHPWTLFECHAAEASSDPS